MTDVLTVRLACPTNRSQVLLADQTRIHDLWQISGTPASETWAPLPVTLITEENGRAYAPTEVFDTSPVLTMTRSAWTRIGHLVAPFGEELELTCSDLDVVAFNVLVTVDAFDIDTAHVFQSRSGSMLVNEWAFHAEALPANGLFHITERAAGFSILATGAVAEELAALDLPGVRWDTVWQSEQRTGR